MSKLSKSDAGKTITKAQVVRSSITGNWLAVCQEGCGLFIKPGLPFRVAFKIADGHMKQWHGESVYISERISR